MEELGSHRKNNRYVTGNPNGCRFLLPTRSPAGVDIPESDDSKEPLRIPAVAGRVVQIVLKNRLEPYLEPSFHVSSHGCCSETSSLQVLPSYRKDG